MNAYENIITQAFKSSLDSGNPAAVKFMKEQNALKKAEEKKRREMQKLKRRRHSNTSTAMNTARTQETNGKTLQTEKSEKQTQEQVNLFK